jgi:TonB family protein
MRSTWTGLAVSCSLGLLFVHGPVPGQTTAPKYHAAAVSQAGFIPFPMNTQTPGFVSVDVLVTSNGMPQDVVVVRDLPPLTSGVVGAVRGWQYTPATLNGDAVPGIVPIAVAFNPYNPSGVGLPGLSLQPPQAKVVSNFQPPGLVQASYANYPPNTVVSGTVVLKVGIGTVGRVHEVTVVQGIDALDTPSINAAKTWQFTPAMYKGKPVPADVIVAFVYAPPQAGTR